MLDGSASPGWARLRALLSFFDWARDLCGVVREAAQCWESSTAFSGAGCLELAADALTVGAGKRFFGFTCGVDKDPVARRVFAGHSPGVEVHTDILGWLSPGLLSKISGLQGDNFRTAIFDARARLNLGHPGSGSYSFGDCHIAGPPCVGENVGAGRRERGRSMACLYVWARAVRECAPMFVIVENVPRFPVSLLRSLFEDRYNIDWIIFDAVDLGAPARRRRLYVVVTLREKLARGRPLSELMGVVQLAFPAKRSWEDFFV